MTAAIQSDHELRSAERWTVRAGSAGDSGLPQRYSMGKQLGKGGFAEVFLCHDSTSSAQLAVKVIHKAHITKHCVPAKLSSEIAIHRALDHERVVRFLDNFEDKSDVFIVMELCQNHSLSDFARKRPGKRMSEAEAQFYLHDLVVGLTYLHSRRVIHRDLKQGNLFLDQHARLKIGDFGLAARLESDGEHRKTQCGTPGYMAPEILSNAGHSFQVDIWSTGIVAYKMVCGKLPFEAADVKAMYKRIQHCNYTFPEFASEHVRDMITKILRVDPRARPGLDDILEMPWFSGTRVPPTLPPTVVDMIACTARPSSAIRSETPEGQRFANCGRIDSPMHRAKRSTCSTAAAPLLQKQPCTPGSPRAPATTRRGAGVSAVAGRPPVARAPSEENVNPNPRRCSDDKIKTRHGSSRGMPSVQAGSATRSIVAQNLGCRFIASRPGRSNAEEAPIAEPLTQTPRCCDMPVSCRRASSESPGPGTRNPLAQLGGGMLDFMRGSVAGLRLAALIASGVARDVEPDALPEVWVSKWVDYSSRYGVVYQLSDGAIGVYYNDSTKIICPSDGSSFDYIPRSTAEQKATRTTHAFEGYPADLQKKVTLLQYLRSTMATDMPVKFEGVIPGESTMPQSSSTGAGTSEVYVRKWSRRRSAILFLLSNKDIHVVFFDKTEVILSFRNHAVTYSDKCGSMRTSSLSNALNSPSADLSKRLRYILSNFLGVAASDLSAAIHT